MSSGVWVVLPAYNEAQNLGGLIDAVVAHVGPAAARLGVIVVDDGSTDGTCEIARSRSDRCRIDLIVHAQNEGLGATLRDGLRRAAELAGDDDAVVTMDADGSHLPEQIPEMLAALDSGSDVVLCSRYRRGASSRGVPPHRRFLSFGMRALGKVIAPLPGVTEYTCAFRAIRGSLLKRAFSRYGDRVIRERGFAATVQLLLHLSRLEPHIAEIPMSLRYDRKLSASRLRIARTVARSLWVLVQYRLGA